jgi:hypothetical protein
MGDLLKIGRFPTGLEEFDEGPRQDGDSQGVFRVRLSRGIN